MPWRLSSDLSLVSSDRTLYPVCKFLRKLATEQGIGELEIEDHQLEPRYHAVACMELVFDFSVFEALGSSDVTL